jgi:hypothetical protein
VFGSLSFAAWGFGTLGGVCSLGVRIFGLHCLGVRNFGSTVFWLAGYLGSAHLDHRISVSLCGCLLRVVWFFGFFLGSHGTLVAVSAPLMMPLHDSDIPMNVPFTFSNKQPLARRHRREHRPHVPTLMRGNTPPTTRSPPHQSRRTGNPPNLQPVTVSEEERGGRDPTSRRMQMREAPYCRPPPTARYASQPRSSTTSHPPQKQDTVHRELRPGTGKGARAGAGLLRRATRPAAGPRRRSPSRHVPCQQQQAGGNEDILSSGTGPSTA